MIRIRVVNVLNEWEGTIESWPPPEPYAEVTDDTGRKSLVFSKLLVLISTS